MSLVHDVLFNAFRRIHSAADAQVPCACVRVGAVQLAACKSTSVAFSFARSSASTVHCFHSQTWVSELSSRQGLPAELTSSSILCLYIDTR
jgi:hypothetical protein